MTEVGSWPISVSDATAKQVVTYMSGHLTNDAGPYHWQFNSCATWVWEVLNQIRADVPGLPAARPTFPTPALNNQQAMEDLSTQLYVYLNSKTNPKKQK